MGGRLFFWADPLQIAFARLTEFVRGSDTRAMGISRGICRASESHESRSEKRTKSHVRKVSLLRSPQHGITRPSATNEERFVAFLSSSATVRGRLKPTSPSSETRKDPMYEQLIIIKYIIHVHLLSKLTYSSTGPQRDIGNAVSWCFQSPFA